MKRAMFFAVLFFTFSGSVSAQISGPAKTKQSEQIKPAEKTTEPNKIKKPKPATYLKVNLIHGDFGLYGYNYNFNDLSLEIENYWGRRHGGFAGFSFGYRKEDFSSSNYGHFLNSKIFWKIEKQGFYFRPGIGTEWGKPSSRFEQTHFHYDGAKLISYERIYRERNAWMPVGVKNTGTLNPFFEFGVGRKKGLFIFEGGARIGYGKFGIETFRFTNGDLMFQGLNREYNFIPTFYAGIGLKIF